MSATGVNPAEIGMEIRVGRIARENAATRAQRLLLEGRVMVRYWGVDRGQAWVRGDSGMVRKVEVQGDEWTCTCPALSQACAHIRAVKAVTVRSHIPEA